MLALWVALRASVEDTVILKKMLMIKSTVYIYVVLSLGTVWCLDYKYTAYGNSNGQLNTYMMVNGEKGEVLRSRSGSLSTKVWYREQIILDGTTLSQTDMVEVSADIQSVIHHIRKYCLCTICIHSIWPCLHQ